MDALQAVSLRLVLILFMVTALVFTGVGVPTPEDGTLLPQAWAGGDDDDDDDDDDHGKGRDKHKSKDFDHFACYTAASHTVDTDVEIINQFTRDEYGKFVKMPITVGELTLLCVPTKKIHNIEDDDKKDDKKKKKKK